jgi:hypothetical protein
MRLTEDRIKAGILHPDRDVRDAEEDDDLLFDEGQDAMVQIGTDAAVEGAATLLSHGDWIRRVTGCNVLQ